MDQRSRFLIVDDDDTGRMILVHTLTHAFPGATIAQVGDCAAALAAAGTEHFDAVLTDYNMPDGDGLELIEKLRDRHVDLPTILVTGVGDELLAAEALHRGASDYIPKSRINTESIGRVILRAIHTTNLSRHIREQASELEHFAYALAHDFKQPIRQIRTFAALVKDEVNIAPGDPARQYLRFLEEAAGRLSELVDVMSQYTLLLQPPAMNAVNLDTVFSQVQEVLAGYVEERNGEIEFTGHGEVHGSPTLLRQIFENLIVNGLKYNKSAHPRVEIATQDMPDGILLRVRDNGIGIEAQYLTEIFKPLTRLHAASEYPGTGLGLTLTRKAVMVQGGEIWCESVPGAGSTFHIVLPRAGAQAQKTAIAV